MKIYQSLCLFTLVAITAFSLGGCKGNSDSAATSSQNSERLSENSSPSERTVERAERVLNDVRNGDQQDFNVLMDFVLNLEKDQKNFQFETIKAKALAYLIKDKERLMHLRANLVEEKQSNRWILARALKKFIGEESQGDKGSPGILGEVHKMMSDFSSVQDFKSDRVYFTGGRQITLVKTALIYFAVASGEWSWANQGKALSLVYPVIFQLPTETAKLQILETEGVFDSALISKHSATGEWVLNIPNAGFVFGGNFFGDQSRGVDASAYVCYCADVDRMSTSQLMYLWKKLKDPTYEVPKDFEKVIKNAARKLIAIELETQDLRPGDIVVWRSENDGHAAVFKNWTSLEKKIFDGYVATRKEVSPTEGVGIDSLDLLQTDRGTYVLRRK